MSFQRKLERWIILIHRWIGIAVCVLFVVWFASGLVMLHTTYPRLMDHEYREGLTTLQWDRVLLSPEAALTATGQTEFPRTLRLEMSAGEPVYRVASWDGRQAAVSATTGQVLSFLEKDQALRIARDFAPDSRPTWTDLIEVDQWTFATTFDAYRPLHRIALNDADARELYISARTGAVVLDSTRHERTWNWFGLIPHLFSLDEIRLQPTLWRALLMWTTVPSLVVALCGLWIGITRLRVVKRYPRGKMSPFRGMMKWHHVLGLIGGVTLFAWVLGAFIYLRPNHFLEREPLSAQSLRDYTGAPGPSFPLTLESRVQDPSSSITASFAWVAGRPFVLLTDRGATVRVVDAGGDVLNRVSPEVIEDAVHRLMPAAPIERLHELTEPDEYWHTFKLTIRPLPIFRVELGDPDRRWLHIDPRTGEILNTTEAGDRAFRWLFNGMHKFDFLFLSRHGALRDVVVWILMLCGLALSVTGVVVGWKRLRATTT